MVEERTAEKEAKKREDAERKSVATEEAKRPSLFVIVLRYHVNLDRVDAVMNDHVKFLDGHYKAGHFCVLGRQVPRTGGVIITWGKSKG